MIQGGDPTGTGRGGTSIYGAQFEDEIVLPDLAIRRRMSDLCARADHVLCPTAPRTSIHWRRDPGNGELGAEYEWESILHYFGTDT